MNDVANQTHIAEALKPILAETSQLYMLTQNVHWNITGPLFQSIHQLTENQYTELALAVEELAERIRMLGMRAPGSMRAYLTLGNIEEGDENADPETMVVSLAQGHQQVAKRIRPVLADAAKTNDEVTAGLLTDRLTSHEKAIWMLESMLGS